MTANIRPQVPPHSECWRQDLSSWGQPGDVRHCIHGKVQVLTEVGPNARVMGPGTHWWRTLSRFWNPLLYRRAEAALFADARRQSKEETIRIRNENGGW